MSNSRSYDTEVNDREGTRYLLRINAYPAADGKVDGAVVALVAVPPAKKSAE